jgi:hypothetical protein
MTARVALCERIAHAPLCPSAHRVPGALQLLPASGVLLAPALEPSELPELLAPLPLEAADAAAHRQDDAPLLNAHRLGGPVDGIETFLAPGVLHLHLRMLPAQCARGLNRTKKGAEDSLHRLAVPGKAPFSQLMQVVLVRPPGMAHSGLSVGINADVPDLGRFAARAALRRRKALGDREVR